MDNKQMGEKYLVILEKIDNLNGIVIRVEKKIDEVNGQVKSNRKRISKLEGWRLFFAGGLAVIITLVLPVLFVIVAKQI